MVRQQRKRDAAPDAGGDEEDVYEVLIKAGRGLLKALPKSKDALKSLLKVRGRAPRRRGAAPHRRPSLAPRLSSAWTTRAQGIGQTLSDTEQGAEARLAVGDLAKGLAAKEVLHHKDKVGLAADAAITGPRERAPARGEADGAAFC